MYQISVCIPVYNQDISSLCGELFRQRSSLDAKIELVVMDDGSEENLKKPNRKLKDEPDTQYHELEKNGGRAAIRNRLAASASGKHLLFLDDDSRLIRQDFLQKYLKHCEENTVVCGGREYSHTVPGPEYSLHYRYGRFKESRNTEQRSQNPYSSFHSNNFLVPKDVLRKVPFDESLSQYGHEDTLFSFHLKKHKIPVKHISNPILHAQLETNKEFLSKSQNAIQNLKFLYDRNEAGFPRMIKVLRAYQRVKKTGLQSSIAGLFKKNKERWENHLLHSEKPSMRIFNLYKLGYLCGL